MLKIKLSSKLDGISEFLIIVFASFETNFPQTTQEVSNICGTAPERPPVLSTFILAIAIFNHSVVIWMDQPSTGSAFR